MPRLPLFPGDGVLKVVQNFFHQQEYMVVSLSRGTQRIKRHCVEGLHEKTATCNSRGMPSEELLKSRSLHAQARETCWWTSEQPWLF